MRSWLLVSAALCGIGVSRASVLPYSETIEDKITKCFASDQNGLCKCPYGYFISSLKKRDCDKLSCMDILYCSRVAGINVFHSKCEDQDVDWDGQGWAKCEGDDKVVVGFKRTGDNDDVTSLSKLRCCKAEAAGFDVTVKMSTVDYTPCTGKGSTEDCPDVKGGALFGLYREGQSGSCDGLHCIKKALLISFRADETPKVALPYVDQYLDVRQNCMSTDTETVCQCQAGYGISALRVADKCHKLSCMYSWLCSEIKGVEIDYERAGCAWVESRLGLSPPVYADCPEGMVIVGFRRDGSRPDNLRGLKHVKCCPAVVGGNVISAPVDTLVRCSKGVLCGSHDEHALLSGMSALGDCVGPRCIKHVRSVQFYGVARPEVPVAKPKGDRLGFEEVYVNEKDACFGPDTFGYCGCPEDTALAALGKMTVGNELSDMTHWRCAKPKRRIQIPTGTHSCKDIPVVFNEEGWVRCPVGYVALGFKRADETDDLMDLREMRCCEPKLFGGIELGNTKSVDYSKCMKSSAEGSCEVVDGGMITGVFHEGTIWACRDLYCITKVEVTFLHDAP